MLWAVWPRPWEHRVLVTADRGFADVALLTLLSQLGVTCIIRVQSRHPRLVPGQVAQVGQLGLRGNERHRSFGAFGLL